ncbi:MAG: hypothetical protein ACYCYN_09345 [Solirubrobacteraceae bacterium]
MPAEAPALARSEVREHFERLIDRERAVARVQAGDDVDDDDEGVADDPEAPAEPERPVRAPQLVKMGPNGPIRSDAEIKRDVAEAMRLGRGRDGSGGSPSFLAGRRSGRGW